MVSSRSVRQWAYRGFSVLPGPARRVGDVVLRRRAERQVRAEKGFAPASRRLVIGPRNTAGQAWAWARAAERHLEDVSARSLMAESRTGNLLAYPHDWSLSTAAQLRGLAPHRARVLTATHLLSESGRALLGDVHHATVLQDREALVAARIRHAVLLHGSEVRDLRRHAERYAHSPFRVPWDERWERMQTVVERTRQVLEAYDGPVFVSTPDLLDDQPGATVLPVTVDVERFALDRPVLTRRTPVVLHAPSNPRLKGTEAVEEAMRALERRGVITYRRLQGVPHAAMPEAIADADIVIDQVVLGNPGTLVAESLAAGRVVIAHLSPEVRARMAQSDSAGREVPVVEADAATLGDVVAEVVAQRDDFREVASAGPAWAREHHDGRAAAAALAGFLATP